MLKALSLKFLVVCLAVYSVIAKRQKHLQEKNLISE